MTSVLILLMRHAEKPLDPLDQNLLDAGKARADAPARYIPEDVATPNFLFAPAASKYSVRPIPDADTAFGKTFASNQHQNCRSRLPKPLRKSWRGVSPDRRVNANRPHFPLSAFRFFASGATACVCPGAWACTSRSCGPSRSPILARSPLSPPGDLAVTWWHHASTEETSAGACNSRPRSALRTERDRQGSGEGGGGV
jgi:hypothetical protein